MNLLMISGDRSILQGRKSAFWYTLQGLRQHWDRIDIICPNPHAKKGSAVERLSKSEAPKMPSGRSSVFLHPNPSLSLWSHPSWIVKKGMELHKRVGIDVATVHDYPPFYNGIGAKRLHNKTRIPYVTELHHIIGYPVPANWQEKVGYCLSRLYMKHNVSTSSAIRVVNSVVQSILISWGVPRDKIHIVSSFYLDTDMLRNASMPPIAYDVAFCARIVPNKGLGALIDAAEIVPNLRMIIIGDGPERARYEKDVKDRGLDGRITFTGWLPNKEAVIQAMKSSRMFVMNSLSEGGPRVLLEAMGCGLPAISTPVGIAPDVIKEGVNGLFTSGKAADLASKIQYVLEHDALRESMGREAKKVLDYYDGDTLMAEYCRFLQSHA